MKTTIAPLALTLTTLFCAATTAQAGTPTVTDVSTSVAQASWDHCVTLIDRMTEAGMSPLTQVTIRSGRSSLDAGSYALSELRATCVAKYIPRGLKDLAFAGRMMLERGALLETATDADLQTARDMTASCHAGAERLLALGVAPGTPVWVAQATYRLDRVEADLCSQGDAFLAAANRRILDTFVGVLERDKRRLIEASPVDGYIAVPPGEGTRDPEVLARAKLWFQVASRDPGDGDRCPTTIYSYRRFQFDARHRLVKQSTKEYCGDPGGRALR